MSINRNLLSENRKYLYGVITLFFITMIFVAFGMSDNSDFDVARREVLLRKIGDELLIQSGDNKSRVLPIEKITEIEYQIKFENEITFDPDSLVNTVQRLLASDPLTSDYVVNVVNCGNSSVAYGYAIANNKKDDIIACRGRLQPKGCYMINIKFKPTRINTGTISYMLSIFIVLMFFGFIFWRLDKLRKERPVDQNNNILAFGSVLFNPQQREMIINKNTIDLTGTETRLLHIFALSPNQTIERVRLQKEIWEDEGVIVGRSLDMFISKLRKKLEFDTKIKITVIRGKGYKLEISS
ncbi:MAG: winged helix-turn-helix domain-containing protein [Sphingobacterium sp.]|uniref:winged helix-turn-helix domain-containing protein n=1 Tax=Sphingobacterium sp. TaxID=341027 RepID=UPI00283D08CE|nr:winged helix-turn-helix domain-containing protein [Sphingobacterium sp.]MDR3010298.1 winged helix-turn-helix domain-containing protein [Sphingobacterium sp.]